jgi:hypothetical protein
MIGWENECVRIRSEKKLDAQHRGKRDSDDEVEILLEIEEDMNGLCSWDTIVSYDLTI